MAENRVTQIVGETIHESTTSFLRVTQIAGLVLFTDGGGTTPDPPKIFKPGGYGVQILD